MTKKTLRDKYFSKPVAKPMMKKEETLSNDIVLRKEPTNARELADKQDEDRMTQHEKTMAEFKRLFGI